MKKTTKIQIFRALLTWDARANAFADQCTEFLETLLHVQPKVEPKGPKIMSTAYPDGRVVTHNTTQP